MLFTNSVLYYWLHCQKRAINLPACLRTHDDDQQTVMANEPVGRENGQKRRDAGSHHLDSVPLFGRICNKPRAQYPVGDNL